MDASAQAQKEVLNLLKVLADQNYDVSLETDHGFVSMGYVLSQEVWSRRGGERTTRLLIDYALQNKMIISPTNTN